MEYDINKAPSYEHMMGSEKRAHHGSQSSAPTSAKGHNEGLKAPMSIKGSPAPATKVV